MTNSGAEFKRVRWFLVGWLFGLGFSQSNRGKCQAVCGPRSFFGCWPCPARGPTRIADLILNSQRRDGLDGTSVEGGRVGTETLSPFAACTLLTTAAQAGNLRAAAAPPHTALQLLDNVAQRRILARQAELALCVNVPLCLPQPHAPPALLRVPSPCVEPTLSLSEPPDCPQLSPQFIVWFILVLSPDLIQP